MATTFFTRIQEASEDETELFKEISMADHQVKGVCVLVNEIKPYTSCPKHRKKVDEEGHCPSCGEGTVDEKLLYEDFRCNLLIEDENDESNVVTVTAFRKHFNMLHLETNDEDLVNEVLEEELVGKECQVDYNAEGNQDNVAVKLVIM